MFKPLITVVVPAYNYADFLEETLESIISQTYTNWECLIINDGSEDNTEDVAIKYSERDKRFKYFYKQNGGLSSARNKGIQNAKGEYIIFIDADDIIKPQKFEMHIERFSQKPDLTVVYSNFNYIDTNGLLLPDSPFARIKLKGDSYSDFALNWGFEFVIPIHCSIIKFEFLKINGIFFEEALKAREDWLFWIKMSGNGASFDFIDEKLSLYRKHEKSMVHDPEHMFFNTIKASFKVHSLLHENLKEEFENKYAQYIVNEGSYYKERFVALQTTRLFRYYRKIKKIFPKK